MHDAPSLRSFVSLTRVRPAQKRYYSIPHNRLATAQRFVPDMSKPLGTNGTVTVVLDTPARLKSEGHYVSDLPFHVLVRNLLRRLSALSSFHCGHELQADFGGLIRKAEQVSTKRTEIRWEEFERYSTRQKQRMRMGGVAGVVEYAGDVGDLTPYLRLGEWVHVGKATSFGFGRYRIL